MPTQRDGPRTREVGQLARQRLKPRICQFEAPQADGQRPYCLGAGWWDVQRDGKRAQGRQVCKVHSAVAEHARRGCVQLKPLQATQDACVGWGEREGGKLSCC